MPRNEAGEGKLLQKSLAFLKTTRLRQIARRFYSWLRSQYKKEIVTIIVQDMFSQQAKAQNDMLTAHINATYRWLCAAQDATPDSGVSAFYLLLSDRWQASYPETTGYIIPTMLTIARLDDYGEARSRALAMADWEIEVQLPGGAVRSRTIDHEPIPAVFNTGQVIFGWVRAYEETSDEKYISAAQRAADWLLNVQDEDGAWRRCLSPVLSVSVGTYNARTAWALILLGQAIGEQQYTKSGRLNLDWCLTQQRPTGWFANNDFRQQETPLLHTIGYVTEGILEAGVLLGENRYIMAAECASLALLNRFETEGVLWGCYNEHWQPTVSWRCLTGEAQMALVWFRLYKITGNESYLKAGILVNRQLMALQKLDSKCSGIAGGVKGSHPIWGDYLPYSYPNWAAKFFLDSLLLETELWQGWQNH